jgi:uncharacterized protein YbcC (UPF0753/DUF2309 family)
MKSDLSFNLREAIHRLSHWLPSQGPIQNFVHHNTLHAFQELPFEEAVQRGGLLYGARSYLTLSEYRKRYREGRISQSVLQALLAERFPELAVRKLWEGRLMKSGFESSPAGPGLAKRGIRSRWVHEYGINLDRRVHPFLFQLVGNYLDQGIAVWRLPHASESLFEAARRLVSESGYPVNVLSRPSLKPLLEGTSENAILAALDRIVGAPQCFEGYLLEMLLAHPGWSGMVKEVEHQPHTLISKRKASLQDFIAIELLLELGWLERELGKKFEPLCDSSAPAYQEPTQWTLGIDPIFQAEALWQEAYERSVHQELLSALQFNGTSSPQAESTQTELQAFFCIDDRECSLRRHLEEIDAGIRTFSTAGFFGVDVFFQGAQDAFPSKHCPVPVQPKHVLRERSKPTQKKAASLPMLSLSSGANTFFRGMLVSQVLGAWAMIRLAASIFRPSLTPASATSLSRVDDEAHFQIERESDEKTEEGLLVGYSLPEMADRVQAVLKGAGVRSLGQLVVFFGHGASSTNNPHFAAYDCGACSGRPGAPNARAFAKMANHPDVREELRRRGVNIPTESWFVGALHDTTRDEVRFYDLAHLPESQKERLAQFEAKLQQALERNAKERCRRFETVPLRIRPDSALEEVRRRSVSIFEPRPEYNHATNAFCIVGRRSLTQGLFLDRRAFINSYDPKQDPEGITLSGILNAVIPVCGGISLEYYFSRVDNSVYGAGTKLPHNVIGLVGVANGVEGDLQAGLPAQMVEIHEPLRILFVLEQDPEIALIALQRNPAVFEWVKNEWVKCACIHPETREVYEFRTDSFRAWDLSHASRIAHCDDSLKWAERGREDLPFCRVGGRL